MPVPPIPRIVRRLGPPAAMVAGLLAWLWPIGVGGEMPVGGDATNFSIGLMAFLGRSLSAGRLPLWNDLWGYGFPGVAESQMGAFYPPHLVLYGLLPTELAYTLSLVLHTLWAALGARWAARRFGVGEIGASLSGFVWAASGFYLIHLPHQWGYTVGSWMPWAWGLARVVSRGGGSRPTLLLAAVLAVQTLPGHFQLAFQTQVGVALIGLCGLVDRQPGSTRALGPLALAGLLAAPLAAAQLWPTYQLSKLAESSRTLDYLAGFSANPPNLIGYVAPGLTARSRLWRPVAWDTFHASPEEVLGYVGLVPLFLALGAIGRGWRTDPGTRLLAVLAASTIYLSMGPYVPGFAALARLPGFSFFRAPARWQASTALALAILAGKGLDALPTWPRPGRSLRRFALAASLAIAAVVGTFELALAATDGPGLPAIASIYDRALSLVPWPDRPDLRTLMAAARTPRGDVATRASLAQEGARVDGPDDLRLDRQRFRLYLLELGETAGLLLALGLASTRLARPRRGVALLVALAVADLLILGRHRVQESAPIGPLAGLSPVLVSLPAGERLAGNLGNLPLRAGAATISSYRTLDIPALPELNALATSAADTNPYAARALRAAGASSRVLGPYPAAEASRLPAPATGRREAIDDPALTGWLYGAAYARGPGAKSSTFLAWRPAGQTARAWLVPASLRGALDGDSADIGGVLRVVEGSAPLGSNSPRPERVRVEATADGPSAILVSSLSHPGWRATLDGPGGPRPVPIRRAFGDERGGGWQAVDLPGPGRWRLDLTYPGLEVYWGLAVSAVAWALWLVAFGSAIMRRVR